MNQPRSFYDFSELKLDKNRRRVKECPCGRSNRDWKFCPFVGYEDKGRCFSCGEWFMPELPDREDHAVPVPRPNRMPKPTSYIEEEVVRRTLKKYSDNHFAVYLMSLVGEEPANRLLVKYGVGTSKKWPGATVFWQRDINGKIRTGKIMLYDLKTGKRVKEPRSHISFAHAELKFEGFNLRQCFFGEHLLADDTRPVAIAESEKTAIIASYYLPQFIWLASGGADGFTDEKCKVLGGRDVMLYPDLSKPEKVNCHEAWSRKAADLNRLIANSYYQVSSILEDNATEEQRKDGLDLADFLIDKHEEFRCAKPVPELAADVVECLPAEREITSVPEPMSIAGSRQAAFDRLKEIYPNINILAERLGLEFVDGTHKMC